MKGVRKKGLSPVIATVLLIAIVIAIALIVFLYFRTAFIETPIEKFGKNIKLVCMEDVSFEASYSGGKLQIVNKGNMPIFSMKVRIYEGGSYSTEDIKDISSDWLGDGLKQGGTFSSYISAINSDTTKLLLIPVLLGESEEGTKSHVCDDSSGIEVEI